MSYTHRLAVIAYVFRDNKFLLLKRNNEPKVWGPPGGRLTTDEDPNTGILREIKEETGLNITILSPADVWHGEYNGRILVSIDYLAETDSEEVKLSSEHSEFCWASIEDLRNKNPLLGETKKSFLLKDFEKAWMIYQKIK
ncbi:NUDIX domain-containing protein [bacterium]|nr:NUDIX domain-containing protein [bacterium]